jgi:hypothetical protein
VYCLTGESGQALGACGGLERGLTNVQLKKALEDPWVSLEGAEGHFAEDWRAIHHKQAAGHDAWKALDAAVSLLIEREVIGFKGEGESCGLTKAEGHALACNGVD